MDTTQFGQTFINWMKNRTAGIPYRMEAESKTETWTVMYYFFLF